MAVPTLVLGDFDLTDWAGTAYGTAVIAEGTSRGAPVPIEVAVKSWLQDGSIVVTQGYDNRTVTLRVKLNGSDLTACAEAEAALNMELGKPNTLTWTPASGPASVFVVVTSSMEHSPSQDEDIAEGGSSPWRTYNLRLLCKAFVQSVDEVVTAALPTSGTTATLDTCSAATGWSGTIDGVSATVTNTSGVNKVSSASAGPALVTMQKTFTSTSTSGQNMLVIDYTCGNPSGNPLRAFVDGVEVGSVTVQSSGPFGTGFLRAYFLVSASTVSTVKLQWQSDDTISLSVTNVALTGIRPSYGTGRQQSMTLAVTGSARTPGRLDISSPTTSLGESLVFTYPMSPDANGYQPPLSPYLSSSFAGPVADSTMASGSHTQLNATTPLVYGVKKAYLPRGTYLVMGRLGSSSGTTVGRVSMGFTTSAGPVLDTATTKTSPTVTLTTTYKIFALGRISLPTVALSENSTGLVNVSLLQSIDSGGDILVDEVWLFNLSIGRLIWVDCGTGTPAAGGPADRLWIVPPSVAIPRPRVLIGHASDLTNAFTPSTLYSWQQPEFDADGANVFVATMNATDAAVQLRHTPSWHSHAAS